MKTHRLPPSSAEQPQAPFALLLDESLDELSALTLAARAPLAQPLMDPSPGVRAFRAG